LPVKRAAGLATGSPASPPHLSTAIWILAHNARGLAGVLGLLTVAQLAARSPGPARAQLVLRSAGEVVIAGAIAGNVLVTGAAIGGYGTRMLVAMLPHGPVELAAYSLALGLYLRGRRRALPVARMAVVAGASVALLALAAGLETWVSV
jgi:hypothetical protein